MFIQRNLDINKNERYEMVNDVIVEYKVSRFLSSQIANQNVELILKYHKARNLEYLENIQSLTKIAFK